jgi:hypothetical protein
LFSLLAGCMSGDPAVEPVAEADVGAPAETKDPAPEREVFESAGHVLCDVINQVPSFSVGDVNIDKPTCNWTDYDNLYYLGSIPHSIFIQPGQPQPSQKPDAMTKALYCALRDADGAQADGTVSTGVGRFGMLSKLAMTTKDPVGQRIVGQRLGVLYLFGIPITLDSQDISATFPTENTSGLWWHSTGYYMDLQSSTTSWHIGGGGVLPVVPPLTLHISFDENGNFQSLDYDGIAWSPRTSTNGPNPAFAWQPWVDSCNACRANGGLFCDCPQQADWDQHNAFANWTDGQYRNLSDHIIPYGGTAGVTGNYVYRYETSRNWFQFGKPDGALTNDRDPSYGGSNFSPTTHLEFDFGLDYDIIALELNLGVGFRSGMEMTQGQYYVNEFRNHYADVQTHLDAQSGANLDAHLKIANPFPFGPDYLVDETFNIFNTSHEDHKAPTNIAYDDANGYPFYTYMENGTFLNPQTSLDACMSAPPVTNPPVPPTNPQTGLTQAVNQAKQNLFPCHVVLCKPASQGAQYGTVRNCEWDLLRQRLACTDTNTTCDMCRQSAQLCDSSGNVYIPSLITEHIGCDIR